MVYYCLSAKGSTAFEVTDALRGRQGERCKFYQQVRLRPIGVSGQVMRNQTVAKIPVEGKTSQDAVISEPLQLQCALECVVLPVHHLS